MHNVKVSFRIQHGIYFLNYCFSTSTFWWKLGKKKCCLCFLQDVKLSLYWCHTKILLFNVECVNLFKLTHNSCLVHSLFVTKKNTLIFLIHVSSCQQRQEVNIKILQRFVLLIFMWSEKQSFKNYAIFSQFKFFYTLFLKLQAIKMLQNIIMI